MSITAEDKLYTPEDLLSLPDGESFELVAGRLVEKPVGAESAWIGGLLFARLLEFNARHRLGWVFPSDVAYQCFDWLPRHARKPDASFIRVERLPKPPKGLISVAPDLAVEVISPNDLHSEVAIKVREYLQAGVRLVWVINPDSRTADVYRQDGTAAYLMENGILDGEDVLPGFQCRLGDILPEAEDQPVQAEEEPV